mmetsp:Transcript_60564/g.148590  ORF Transcript_60564/g.148590 Transcript_60564/m.148590 type:complete len:312 (+) Transcript_60564:254-1189(+)
MAIESTTNTTADTATMMTSNSSRRRRRTATPSSASKPLIMTSSFGYLIVCVLLFVSTTTTDACQVTIDDVDVTSEFFVEWRENEVPIEAPSSVVASASSEEEGEVVVARRSHPEFFVDCIGKSKCKNAIIENCPYVKCHESEACYQATITNVTETVECLGMHSCHKSQIYFAPKASEDEYQSIDCHDRSACDVTHIEGPDVDLVSCKGPKACRKVVIDVGGAVKCHHGHHNFEACDNFATIDADCLYCGYEGCAAKINQCRVKLHETHLGDKYSKCQPEQVVGHCPASLHQELKFELAEMAALEDEEGDGR